MRKWVWVKLQAASSFEGLVYQEFTLPYTISVVIHEIFATANFQNTIEVYWYGVSDHFGALCIKGLIFHGFTNGRMGLA